MADNAKLPVFGGPTGAANQPKQQQKPADQGKTAPMFPPPIQSNASLEPPKQSVDMLSSFTVPITVPNKNLASFKNAEQKEEQKQQPSLQPTQVGTGDLKGRTQGEKTGGILSGAPQPKATRATAEQSNARQRPITQRIQRQRFVMSTLMDKLLFCRTIQSNSATKDSDLKEFVQMFGRLCGSPKERQDGLKKLDDPAQRRQLLRIKYLMSEQDQKVLDEKQHYLCIIVKKLLERCGYLTVEAGVFLTEQYVSLNEDIYYPQGKFQHQYFKEGQSNFQASPRLVQILRQIETIKQNLFIRFEETLHLLRVKLMAHTREPCHFLEKLLASKDKMSNLGQNIWRSFELIMRAQGQLESKSNLLRYSFEINILLNCLNLYSSLKPVFFTQEVTLEKVLPFLIDSIYLLEAESSVTLNSLDGLVLTLILEHPFSLANLHATAGLKKFLMEDRIRDRYPYLALLIDQRVDPGDIPAVQSCEMAIFLQSYIKLNENIRGYEPSKHGFLLKSICQIFRTSPSFYKINRHMYPRIYKYIDYTVQSIFADREEEDMSSRYRGSREIDTRYVAACRLASLIASLCLPTKGQAINLNRLSQLIRQDTQVINELLMICFEIVQMDGQQNDEFNLQLECFDVTTQAVYELIFRLLIYNSRYFESKQMLVLESFGSLQEFYVKVIVSHVSKFVDCASSSHLNLLALAALVSTPGYFAACQQIFAELSSMKDFIVKVSDQLGNQLEKTQLQFAVEQILSLRPEKPNAFPATVKLLLSVLHYNPLFLQSQWLRTFTTEIKRLTETYHPVIMSRYAETLIEVLRFLSHHRVHLRQIQSHFQFRFINLFLSHVLAFQFEKQSPKVCNKLMRSRQYSEVKLAVLLIREMTSLYLKQKEDGYERVPLQVRRILELQNKGGQYQLLFSKEAVSYSVALIIVFLSRQFVLDHYLRKKEPNFRDEIFEALTNLNLINSLLKYDVNLKIHHLYNRHLEIQINEGLNLKESVLDQIKWNPTYASLEYMMSWSEFRFDLKKELFQKVKDLESSDKAHGLQTKAHFLRVYWKNIASKQLRINIAEAWAYTDGFLKSFEIRAEEVDLSESPEIAQDIFQNIFKLSIHIKDTCLKTYALFLLSYNQYFLDYCKKTQRFQSLVLTENFHQAVLYFFNSKSILSPAIFGSFTKDTSLQSSVYLFIVDMLERSNKTRRNQHGTEREMMTEILLYAVGFLLDVAAYNADLQKWLADILKAVMKLQPVKGEASTKEILLVMLLHARLEKRLTYYDIDFSNHHWLLLTNVIESSDKLSEMLLLDLPSIYTSHSIYFISTCHYFLSAAKTSTLSRLSHSHNLSLQHSFIEVLVTLFHKTIKEARSYYSVWIVEILSEIVANSEVPSNEGQRFYEQIRKIILESQVLHSRIGKLLAKLAGRVGFDMKELRGCWGQLEKVDAQISIAEKLELLGYLRLLTLIYFSPKHRCLSESREKKAQSDSLSLLQKEKQIFLSISSMIPLLCKLMSGKNSQLATSTQLEKQLSKIKLDSFFTKNMQQSILKEQGSMSIHEVWERDTSALDLLDYVSNYELVSMCAVWLGEIVSTSSNKFSIHPDIFKHDTFDRTINNLVTLMDQAVQTLEPYERYKSTIEPVLSQFSRTIYHSTAISKQMHFTNSSSLNSHLSFDFEDISSQISEIVVGVHKIIRKVFEEAKKGAIKAKAEMNFRTRERNLGNVSSMLKNVDLRFFDAMDRSTHMHESEFHSRNLTRSIF